MNVFSVLAKLVFGTIVSIFTGSSFDVSLVNVQNTSPEFITQLKKFEHSFNYPFSDTEQFRIEHGKDGDYFAFFKQLGTPYYYVATCKQDKKVVKVINGNTMEVTYKKGEIAAVGCAVLTKVKTLDGTWIDAWYICDVKVTPKYQGEHLPLLMVQKVGASRFWQCSKGFGICMNPPDKDPKAARIFKKHGQFPGLKTQTLNLYTLTKQQMFDHYITMQRFFIKHGYMQDTQWLSCVSTSGSKDYMIFDQSGQNNRPWNLLHLRPGSEKAYLDQDAVYMVAAVDGTALDSDLKTILGSPSSTAQIVSFGMSNVDFNCITSNQI